MTVSREPGNSSPSEIQQPHSFVGAMFLSDAATAGSADPSIDSLADADIILVFSSNTEVLNVEDFLEESDLPFNLTPVPKEVNPNCGLAISFKERDKDGLLAAIDRAGFKPLASYLRCGDYFSPWVRPEKKERPKA